MVFCVIRQDPDALPPGRRVGTHRSRGCVTTRPGLDGCETQKISCTHRRRTSNHPASDKSLLRRPYSETYTFSVASHNSRTIQQIRPRQLPFTFFNLRYCRGADKSLVRPTSRCRRTESIVSLEANLLLRSNNICLLQTVKNL